ncbi:STAS domain-containing protein [Streptomyces sp. NPDC098789]|uniref:STAS domain-containing protein n=1 Tax=Streptomyces sp. NPDC098789 TaxID=3366098 RepID=UPI00381A81EE
MSGDTATNTDAEGYDAETRGHVGVRTDGDVRIIVMTGEFDMDTVTGLRTAMAPDAPGITRYVLDTAAVTFVDSAALGIMLRPVLERPVVLAGTVPPRLARLLEVTGADRAFAVAATVEEAAVMPIAPWNG